VPAAPKVPEAGPPLPPLSYEARQRRDPFQPQVVTPTGTRGLSVAAVKLVGVVQGRLAPLALVEAPDGIGYILKSGDVLGDGRVTEIGSDSVSFAVAARPGAAPTVVTLRLRTD
jgi:Tfp pilus assembly protein PilP